MGCQCTRREEKRRERRGETDRGGYCGSNIIICRYCSLSTTCWCLIWNSAYNNNSYGLIIMLIFFVLLTVGLIFELGKKALTISSRQNNYK